MKKNIIKETYLLAVIVVGLFVLSVYSTYSMFTANTRIENAINLTAGTLPSETELIEYKTVTIPAGDYKIIDLTINNITENSLYYGVWYEMVSPATTNDNIVMAKLDTSNYNTTGTISASDAKTITLSLVNDSSEKVIVNIGVGNSVTSSLNLTTGKTLITDTWSEPIDASMACVPEASMITNFEYTGNVQEYSIECTGDYKLEVWGAQGGTYGGKAGGLGGYSYGNISLNAGQTINVYVGGQGAVNTAGYNGGGLAAGASAAGGGGGTDIRIDTESDNATTLYERVIVAGGGGGSGQDSCATAITGYGGGTSGGGASSQGSCGTQGGGGTQTSGGTAGIYSSTYGAVGSFGQGGASSNGSYDGGAGGGGWYGGGSGASAGRSNGAGGGSGYVYTSATASNYPSGCLLNSNYYLTNASTIAGNESFTDPNGSIVTGHVGNGYARVTYQITVPSLDGLTNKSVSQGTSFDLASDVSCVDNGAGCTIVSVNPSNTVSLPSGTHKIKYIVRDNNGTKYLYKRTVNISSTDASLLYNKAQIGEYVSYVGNNGCSTALCGGSSTYTSSKAAAGWRVAYKKDSSVYLIAGDSFYRQTGVGYDSTSNITNFNTVALTFCNQDYVQDGICNSTTAHCINDDDFFQITLQSSGTGYHLHTNFGTPYCYQSSSTACGLGNPILDIGDNYWFASAEDASLTLYWNVNSINSLNGSVSYAVRPVLKLDSSIAVTGGLGTPSNPYQISTN